MDFDELISSASAQAMAEYLVPTPASGWHKMCRIYSKKFHTPLHTVLTLDAEYVALQVFADNLDEQEDSDGLLENILDLVYTLSDPEYAAAKEAELEEFIEVAKEQEEERIKKGRPIHPALRADSDPVRRSPSQADTAQIPEKSGAVDLSHLDDENER